MMNIPRSDTFFMIAWHGVPSFHSDRVDRLFYFTECRDVQSQFGGGDTIRDWTFYLFVF